MQPTERKWITVNGTATKTPAAVLRAAASYFETDPTRWGRHFYRNSKTGCRCALGGIAWAVDPDDEDGDLSIYAYGPSFAAAALLMDYLIIEVGVPCEIPTPVCVVGAWNDDERTGVTDVITGLRAAADRAERVPA